MAETEADPAAVVRRLQDAANAHDIDAIVGCFAPDYRNETPAHPARGFTGREQVRRNWTRILAGVPDVAVEVVASATAGNTVWTEWEHRGTRADGSPHLMRGVIVFSVRQDLISTARFFLEPVEPGGDGVDAAVERLMQPRTSP
jgi:hypothetical protein